MYKHKPFRKTSITKNDWTVGETMETKLRRIIANKEQLKDNVDLTYADANDGVAAQFNIRTDKWEAAISALDINSKRAALQGQAIGAVAKQNMETEAQTELPKTDANEQ